MKRIVFLALVCLAAPALAADYAFALSALSERQQDLLLIGAALLACVLAVFPVRFIAKLFRG